MILVFGNVFMGQVKTQEKQWIETSVFVFIIPQYAQSSMLVTDVTSSGRRGLEIKKNTTSVITPFLRLILFLMWGFLYWLLSQITIASDWKEKLNSTPYNEDWFQLCYCLTALENCIHYNADVEKLLHEIAMRNLEN